MKQDPLHIGDMLEPGISSMGYELVGIEFQAGGKRLGILSQFTSKAIESSDTTLVFNERFLPRLVVGK